MRRWSRLVAVVGGVVALVALSGCRVDVTTSVQLDTSGAGAVTVDLVADDEVLQRVPDLAAQLRLDDLLASGWQSDGPVLTGDGGLRVTLVHEVANIDEANEVLAELNGPDGPYRDLQLTRSADDAAVVTDLTGALGARGGAAALVDDEVQALLPDVPLADLLLAPDGSMHDVGDVLGVRLVVGLPDTDGDVTSVTFDDVGTTAARVFDMPADGSKLDVQVQSVAQIDTGMRAPFVALIAGLALVAWLAVSITFARYVLRHHRARPRGPRTAP